MKLRNVILIFTVGTALGVAAVWIFRGPHSVTQPAAPIEVEPVVPKPPPLPPPPIAHEPRAAESPEPPMREQRSAPDLVSGARSWRVEVRANHTFDAERLEARPCFSSSDVKWIQAHWEELDEKRRDLLDRVNDGAAPEGEREWVEIVDTLRGAIGEEGYNGLLYATRQYNGVKVSNISNGSRAQQAGLQNGDQVIHYNGVRVHKPEALRDLAQEETSDELVDIEVRRTSGLIETVPIEPGPLGGIFRRKQVSPCPEEVEWVNEDLGRRPSRGRGGRRRAEAAEATPADEGDGNE